jgi:hypothetical protein
MSCITKRVQNVNEMSAVNIINAHGKFSGSLCHFLVPDKNQHTAGHII